MLSIGIELTKVVNLSTRTRARTVAIWFFGAYKRWSEGRGNKCHKAIAVYRNVNIKH